MQILYKNLKIDQISHVYMLFNVACNYMKDVKRNQIKIKEQKINNKKKTWFTHKSRSLFW